jgi:hypothetical protein
MVASAKNFTTQSLIFTTIIQSGWIIKFCIQYEYLLMLFAFHSLLYNLIQWFSNTSQIMRQVDGIALLSYIMKMWFLSSHHSNWDQCNIQKYHFIFSYGPSWISFIYKTEIKQRIHKPLCINFIICTHCEDYHHSISVAKHQ